MTTTLDSGAGPVSASHTTFRTRGRDTSRVPDTLHIGYLAPGEDQAASQRALRRPSPGLIARLERIDHERNNRLIYKTWPTPERIGRLAEDHLRSLDSQHRDQSIKVERRGRAWTGSGNGTAVDAPEDRDGTMESGLDDSMGREGDLSSIVDIGERMAASDTEESEGSAQDPNEDCRKYRMPEVGKTRLHLHTKQELGPTPGQDTPQPRRELPPTPPARDSPVKLQSPEIGFGGIELDSSDEGFVSSGMSRPGSIYSLSRISFTSQLSQLMSIKLPDAASLSSRITAIPTSPAAAKALVDAGEQIRRWMQKAAEVLSGLDAEDDVEWSAAGGRDGLGDVEQAIGRFESVVKVYVIAIDELQMRGDVASLSIEELQVNVTQMESILKEWLKVREALRGIKEQVEIAMEWEELWNSVLGDIAQEMEGLSRHVFEMEERRHRGFIAESLTDSTASIDIGELETIIEDTPSRGKVGRNNRFSLPPPFSPVSPIQTPPASDSKEDSSLLALFARMQPLRASLDFLPMRLSVFHCRGSQVFPTACLELERRRDALEAQWKRLEADAESLRKELGEDRWVLVFRSAGRQALKMCESITRSYNKLRETIDSGTQQTSSPAIAKKIESYEAKKMHYGPAIERVLAIIDRGVLDRLTVNGEVLRLQSDMKRRWSTLQADMRDMDLVLEELNTNTRNQQLRDSISTILSSERSIASSAVETPGSSPASSVVVSSRENGFARSSTSTANGTVRQPSATRGLDSAFTEKRRVSSLPLTTITLSRRTSFVNSNASITSLVSSTPSRPSLPTPSSSRSGNPSSVAADNRPRWKITGSSSGTFSDFKPLSTTEPSPYRKPESSKPGCTPRSASSHIPVRNTMSRIASTPSQHLSSPLSHPPLGHQPATQSTSKSSPLAAHTSSPLAAQAASAAMGLSTPKPRTPTSASSSRHPATDRRATSLLLPEADAQGTPSLPARNSRAQSSMASGRESRRGSLPAQLQGKGRAAGRESRLDGLATAAAEERRRWRV
ncbi:hypothetical protein LTR66_006666 [Elasticomyces elasticus]|nr:hypothetical protein LTR66_006666 [Elasticomyces elasticus]